MKTKVIKLLQTRISTALYIRVLLAVSLVSTLVAFLFALLGESFLRDGSTGQYLMTDYWETVRFALSKVPYGEELHSSYAPTAFLIVYPFALICKNVAFQLSAAECVRTWQFQLSFWLFFTVCAAACIFLMARFFCEKRKPSTKSLLLVAILFLASAPVYFTVIRANVVIVSLVFLLLYLNFYESEKRTLRVFSYFCLALAGVVKFYALAFGVLLVRKARLKDCLTVFVFFLLLFFLPFCFYGKAGFTGWVTHLNDFLSGASFTVRFHNVSCVQLVVATLDKLSKHLSLSLGAWTKILLTTLQLLFAVFFIFCALFTKSDKRAFRIATVFCCIIANPSYFYIAIFLYPLFFLDLKEKTLPLPLAVFYLAMASCLTLVKWWAAIPHSILLLLYALFLIGSTLREIATIYTGRMLMHHAAAILSGFRYNRLPLNSQSEKSSTESISMQEERE